MPPTHGNSPWGQIDYIDYLLGPSVVAVSTPSHGGIRVDRSYAERELSPAARKHATFYDGVYYWYEEDCDAAIIALEKPLVLEDNEAWASKVLGLYKFEYLYDSGKEYLINIERLREEVNRGNRRDIETLRKILASLEER